MRKHIVISGYGGQGIMLAGGILCQAASIERKNSTFFPSYGAEVRGGAAKCQVIISDEYIGSPILKDIDIFVCFTSMALKKYSSYVKENGIVLFNSDMVSNDETNVLSKNINILQKTSVISAIKEAFASKKKQVLDFNLLAFEKGYNL